MPINGIALGALGVGSVFLWSAIKGKSILATTQSIITGKNPATLPQSNPITDVTSTTDSGSTGNNAPVSNNNIVNIARSHEHDSPYHFGGPPPMGTTDCSSWVSKILNQAGVKNPGGRAYDPRSHGPNTISYLSWNGAHTIGHTANISQPGDLIVGLTHMGIATGNGQYISNHDPAESVSEKPISTFPDPVFSVRRLN
jgi:cell wall-associated NlpC family hydrolase